jgi:nitrogen fixation protein NifU and related proteins
MGDLRDLYQEVIFDHYKRPRNFHKMAGADCCADGHNPLCGDRITVYLKVRDGIIEDVAFEGTGCAISTASASLMTEALKGRTTTEAEQMFAGFHTMVTQSDPEAHPELGKLEVLSGVREFPARVKCATLCWHTLNAALHKQSSVTTE